jgi:hypothetical protein
MFVRVVMDPENEPNQIQRRLVAALDETRLAIVWEINRKIARNARALGDGD